MTDDAFQVPFRNSHGTNLLGLATTQHFVTTMVLSSLDETTSTMFTLKTTTMMLTSLRIMSVVFEMPLAMVSLYCQEETLSI